MPATRTRLPSRFELLADLGQTTFRVRDLDLDQVVVVRVLGKQDGPRLRRELDRLLELDDPSLARILDLGELDDGRPFYVQEFVQGEELFRWAIGRDASEILEVWAQLVRALACYHNKGLVPRGERRLMARVEEPNDEYPRPRLRLVDPGGVVEEGARPIRGTATHGLAPERRARTRVDRRASLYEAGLILYELLAGSDALGLGSIDLEDQGSLRPPVTQLAPGLPLDLATFVMVLLRPYPDERPVSVAAPSKPWLASPASASKESLRLSGSPFRLAASDEGTSSSSSGPGQSRCWPRPAQREVHTSSCSRAHLAQAAADSKTNSPSDWSSRTFASSAQPAGAPEGAPLAPSAS
ncbi:MAG: hypothetical protein JKY65_10310 [Planctomycetes bacterium]|nr:hypothetical protein [Planctomycetota bacterium]